VTATPAPDAWQITRDGATKHSYAAFAVDRRWNGYSIADLAPPLRAWTRVALAQREDGAVAACLFYQHPQFNSTIPHGDPAGLAALLAAGGEAGELPARTFILSRHEHLPAMLEHYAFPEGQQEMIRMAVDRATFKPPPAPAAPQVARLGERDLAALRALYGEYTAGAFTPDQLTNGVFYGVYADDALIAAAGTHVVAASYGIGAIGNVYVTPAARGRGLGGAATAAVAAELLAGPCREVILNVDAANEEAMHIYTRLGFVMHCPYVEAAGVLR